MGNSPKNANAFTRNWRHVAPSLLRNQLTHQLIEQHYLSFANLDQQLLGAQLLAKRIRLHHSHIIKLIYYAPENQLCSCSPLGKPYRTQVYTEYPGDCLVNFMRVNELRLQSKGCSCLSIMQGAIYLQQYYGAFEVLEDRVFFDLQPKQSCAKIWIHPDRAQCQPQKSCSEEQMVQNMARLYSFMNANGFCNALSAQSLQNMLSKRKMSELKNQLIKGHSFGFQENNRQKKSFSAAESKTKLNLAGDKKIQSIDVRVFFKPISVPHQNVSFPHQSFSMPLYSNQKKITFNSNMNLAEIKKKTQAEIQITKMDGQSLMPKKGVSSPQNTLQFISSPKGLNQLKHQHQETKQKNQRINFNYMSLDSYKCKKTNSPFKHQEKLSIFKEQPYPRKLTDIEFNTKNMEKNSYRRLNENAEETNSFSKNIEHRTVLLPLTILAQDEQQILTQKQAKNQNILFQASPLSFSTNPQNSQPSVLITHASVTNSQQTINQQNLVQSHNPYNQMQMTEQVSAPIQQAITALQMQLPLMSGFIKNVPSHLPTTSRSPNKGKEFVNIQPIRQISQVLNSQEINIKGNKMISPQNLLSSRKRSRKPSVANTATKNEKIQRYVKEIKEYEETIRQRLSSSTGNKKFKGFAQNYKNTLKPQTRSDKPGEFKETKSVYNDSEYRLEASQQSLEIEPDQWQAADKIRNSTVKQKGNLYQRQHKQEKQIQIYEKQLKNLYLRQQIQQRQYIKQAQEQREREKQFQIEKLRKIAWQQKKRMDVEIERLNRQNQQKLELERDLQSERKNIQNQMNDLLRQNAMKDEYRCIREKVKQKKETFAQLKAEAAKILEDCLN